MSERKQPPPDQEATAPLWVVTYGDLVSLLVTFFVLLYTFSSIDVEDFRRVTGSLTGAKGLMTDQKQSRPEVVRNETNPDLADQRDGRRERPQRPELEDKKLLRKVQAIELPVDPKFEQLREGGLRIRFQSDRLFLPGATRMSSDGLATLQEVGRLFRSLPVTFRVEAHTDDRSYKDGGFGTPREMTEAMALGVGQALATEAGVERPRIGVCGRSDLDPVASNSSPLGRQKNRRVEIVLVRRGE